MTKKVGEGGSKGLERETRGSSIKSQKRTDREEEDELLGVQNVHYRFIFFLFLTNHLVEFIRSHMVWINPPLQPPSPANISAY